MWTVMVVVAAILTVVLIVVRVVTVRTPSFFSVLRTRIEGHLHKLFVQANNYVMHDILHKCETNRMGLKNKINKLLWAVSLVSPW